MTLALYRLGRACVRRRRLVVLAWLVVAAGVVGAGRASGGRTADVFEIPGVEAQRAVDLLQRRFPEVAGTSAQIVFAAERGTLSRPDAAAAIDAAVADIAAQPDVVAVGTPQRSRDDRIAYAEVQYGRPSSEIRDVAFARLEATAAKVDRAGAVRLELGGDLPSEVDEGNVGGQELLGVAVAVVVLLVAFGSVIAMGLPVGIALVGLATSLGFVTLIASLIEVNSFAETMATMIGLGVGIDYALLIVTRHREHLRAGMTVEEAAGRAIATSGVAVLFAGVTVVIAIAGLAIAQITMVTIMGLMAALAVLVMVTIALTLLPALLGFAGHRIDALHVGRRGGRVEPGATSRETIWHRWGRQVSAHPWRYLLAGGLFLVVLAAPMLSLRLGIPDNGSKPDSRTTRRAYDLLARGFGPGTNGPLLVAVDLGGADVASLGALRRAIARDRGVQDVSPPFPNDDSSAAVLRVVPTTSPQDKLTGALVRRLRDDVIPRALSSTAPRAVAYVGGQTAMFIDLSDKVASRLLWFIVAVILLSAVLLTMVFRSLAVPIKAAAMNLLSIGAAYGLIVAVFQWGWLRTLIGVRETVPIISFVPMLLFAVLFGLSMDYEVFLLSRVREEYLRDGDSNVAVIEGISATARVITSAALIMISVFAGFILSDDPVAKMFGLGLATAVLIDATVVRIVLVPATMRLLGDWNWWLPTWLDRILPRLHIEGGTGLPPPEHEPGQRPAPEAVSTMR